MNTTAHIQARTTMAQAHIGFENEAEARAWIAAKGIPSRNVRYYSDTDAAMRFEPSRTPASVFDFEIRHLSA